MKIQLSSTESSVGTSDSVKQYLSSKIIFVLKITISIFLFIDNYIHVCIALGPFITQLPPLTAI